MTMVEMSPQDAEYRPVPGKLCSQSSSSSNTSSTVGYRITRVVFFHRALCVAIDRRRAGKSNRMENTMSQRAIHQSCAACK